MGPGEIVLLRPGAGISAHGGKNGQLGVAARDGARFDGLDGIGNLQPLQLIQAGECAGADAGHLRSGDLGGQDHFFFVPGVCHDPHFQGLARHGRDLIAQAETLFRIEGLGPVGQGDGGFAIRSGVETGGGIAESRIGNIGEPAGEIDIRHGSAAKEGMAADGGHAFRHGHGGDEGIVFEHLIAKGGGVIGDHDHRIRAVIGNDGGSFIGKESGDFFLGEDRFRADAADDPIRQAAIVIGGGLTGHGHFLMPKGGNVRERQGILIILIQEGKGSGIAGIAHGYAIGGLGFLGGDGCRHFLGVIRLFAAENGDAHAAVFRPGKFGRFIGMAQGRNGEGGREHLPADGADDFFRVPVFRASGIKGGKIHGFFVIAGGGDDLGSREQFKANGAGVFRRVSIHGAGGKQFFQGDAVRMAQCGNFSRINDGFAAFQAVGFIRQAGIHAGGVKARHGFFRMAQGGNIGKDQGIGISGFFKGEGSGIGGLPGIDAIGIPRLLGGHRAGNGLHIIAPLAGEGGSAGAAVLRPVEGGELIGVGKGGDGPFRFREGIEQMLIAVGRLAKIAGVMGDHAVLRAGTGAKIHKGGRGQHGGVISIGAIEAIDGIAAEKILSDRFPGGLAVGIIDHGEKIGQQIAGHFGGGAQEGHPHQQGQPLAQLDIQAGHAVFHDQMGDIIPIFGPGGFRYHARAQDAQGVVILHAPGDIFAAGAVYLYPGEGAAVILGEPRPGKGGHIGDRAVHFVEGVGTDRGGIAFKNDIFCGIGAAPGRAEDIILERGHGFGDHDGGKRIGILKNIGRNGGYAPGDFDGGKGRTAG